MRIANNVSAYKVNYSNIGRRSCKHADMLDTLFYLTYHLDNKPIIIIIIIIETIIQVLPRKQAGAELGHDQDQLYLGLIGSSYMSICLSD